MEKFDLDTPCIVLDLDILEENLGQMQAGATAAGKNLRPHAKSHKCSTLARKQLEKGAIGICAAEVFRQLQAKEASCTIFSGAGTGTCDIDLKIVELSELQVGSYVLMDAEYMAIESAGHLKFAGYFPAALTLLTTVISASQDTHVTVDAGLKSLYRDGGHPQVVTAEHRALRYDWFGD